MDPVLVNVPEVADPVGVNAPEWDGVVAGPINRGITKIAASTTMQAVAMDPTGIPARATRGLCASGSLPAGKSPGTESNRARSSLLSRES